MFLLYWAAATHRKVVAQEINNFDLFIYHEDDIVVKFQHVVMFVTETKKLYDLVPSSLRDNVIGMFS